MAEYAQRAMSFILLAGIRHSVLNAIAGEIFLLICWLSRVIFPSPEFY